MGIPLSSKELSLLNTPLPIPALKISGESLGPGRQWGKVLLRFLDPKPSSQLRQSKISTCTKELFARELRVPAGGRARSL